MALPAGYIKKVYITLNIHNEQHIHIIYLEMVDPSEVYTWLIVYSAFAF